MCVCGVCVWRVCVVCVSVCVACVCGVCECVCVVCVCGVCVVCVCVCGVCVCVCVHVRIRRQVGSLGEELYSDRFGLNLESHGGDNHFMVRHMIGGAKHSGVRHRGVKSTVYEDKVHYVTSRVVTIALPSRLLEWLVLIHVLVMWSWLLTQKSKSLIPFSLHSPTP